jgi:hypothetical protein
MLATHRNCELAILKDENAALRQWLIKALSRR